MADVQTSVIGMTLAPDMCKVGHWHFLC